MRRFAVVPTRVGVDRGEGPPSRREWRRPHARGGGPVLFPNEVASFESSPRAWGWTASMVNCSWRKNVVPTRVGVDRTAYLAAD